MPVVVLCGLPRSGKSELARRLAADCPERAAPAIILSDAVPDDYVSSEAEKRARARLRAGVERAPLAARLVLVDACNLVSGFRYELWCVTRAATAMAGRPISHVTVMMAPPESGATDALTADLRSRFEWPSVTAPQRWDRPLFVADRSWLAPESAAHQAVLQCVAAGAATGGTAHICMATRPAPRRRYPASLQAVDALARQIEEELLWMLTSGENSDGDNEIVEIALPASAGILECSSWAVPPSYAQHIRLLHQTAARRSAVLRDLQRHRQEFFTRSHRARQETDSRVAYLDSLSEYLSHAKR
ncbi:hypothetical protein CDCA_CDCA14G3884 [Cyanidium caldarium]|uniref:Chromatin associated protein KTI12 n=1 Tax=Cyanidium caldarium TaxID=2771 RepID=A0AAV9J0K7_CYACA|nr:hypothetical protein CDCA_CDCA14G3884 [Cyanidium caldarium]